MIAAKLATQYVDGPYIFKQFWQIYPALAPYYVDIERDFKIIPILNWMKERPWLPVVTVTAYLIFCYYGRKVMNNYKPYDLKYTLAGWNLLLSVFSTWGVIRTMPHLVHNIITTSYEHTVCDAATKEWGLGGTGFAVMMFILSKFPELIDTVFIVLKKKPLIFLHWYHHVTVLLYCWNAYVTEAGSGLYFVVMNYTVHAIMYFYYFMMTLRLVPKWFPSWIVTTLQISQMFIGIYVTISAIYYYNYGGQYFKPFECNNRISNMIAGSVMYMSYAFLFLWFALERFIFGAPANSKKTKAVKKVE